MLWYLYLSHNSCSWSSDSALLQIALPRKDNASFASLSLSTQYELKFPTPFDLQNKSPAFLAFLPSCLRSQTKRLVERTISSTLCLSLDLPRSRGSRVDGCSCRAVSLKSMEKVTLSSHALPLSYQANSNIRSVIHAAIATTSCERHSLPISSFVTSNSSVAMISDLTKNLTSTFLWIESV